MTPPIVTIIDPGQTLGGLVGPLLRRSGYRVDIHVSPDELPANRAAATSLVLLDGCCHVSGGAPALVAKLRRVVSVPIIQISGCPSVEEVCRSHPVRADEFLLRQQLGPALLGMVARHLEARNRRTRSSFHGMVGRSTAMRDIFDAVRTVAPTDCTVLVTGETGTGKERIARAIHACSPRADGPFVAVDCGALAPSLVESELFGHARGAFTGAVRDKPGLFEVADRGTLFLDEVGDMSPPAQAALLRALQEREVRRVGTVKARPFDARIVAATRRDLGTLVRTGACREDLFYRLQGFTIEVPPLRERREDIVALVEWYLTSPGRRRCVTQEVTDLLRIHDWPGNVRQLFAALDSAAIRSEGREVGVQHLPSALVDEIRTADPEAYRGALPRERPPAGLDPASAPAILAALHDAEGNRARAATSLGISRTTLWRRMRRLGLRV